MSISRTLHTVLSLSFSLALTLLAFFLLPSLQTNAKMVDKVVAVVNDEIITLSELDKEAESTFNKIKATTPPEQLEEQIVAARAEILDALIDKKIIAQKAAEQKISVSDAEIEQAFGKVLQRTRMNKEQLVAKLHEAGINEQIYKETLRSQILQNKLVGADVTSKIVITEEMVREYYDTHYSAAANSDIEGYYLLQIGITWLTPETKNSPESATQEDKIKARKRIEKIRQMAKSGENFSELARKYSQLPSREDGGDIGTFELEDMATDMRTAVATLRPGEISDIIDMNSGYQFFKLLSAGGNTYTQQDSYEAVKANIKQELYEEQVQKAYAEWVKELKNKAYIQKL